MERYKVKVKLVFEDIIGRTQENKEKALEDVRELVNRYVENGLDLKDLFETSPRLLVEIEE